MLSRPSARIALLHGAVIVLAVAAAAWFGSAEAKRHSRLRWWKGNLHAHSLWSDGDDYPEMIAHWYKSHGYDFLMLSDHNILADHEKWIDVEKSRGKRLAYDKYLARYGEEWVEQREREGRLEVRLKTLEEFRPLFEQQGKFLMIQGEEITDSFQGLPVHVNATNLQDLIPPQGGNSVLEVMQNNVNAVLAQRKATGKSMFPHLNHPNYKYGVTAEDLAAVRGERFFEVYNAAPGVRNEGDERHASLERMWDICLVLRLSKPGGEILYGMGTDDSHSYHDIPSRRSNPGRGWVMVHAPTLHPGVIVEAMEAGDFYTSSGVTLEAIRANGKQLTIRVQPEPGVAYTTRFIGTRKGYDASSSPVRDKDGKKIYATRRYSADIGQVLATKSGPVVTYRFRGNELYVRAIVTSTKLKDNPYAEGEFEQAWIQPALPTN